MKKILIILLMISTMISYSQDYSKLNGFSLHGTKCIVNPESSQTVYDANELFTFSFNDNIFVHSILYLNESSNVITQLYTIVEKKVTRVDGGYIYNIKVQSGVSKAFYIYEALITDETGEILVLNMTNNILYHGTASYVKSIKQ